MKFKEIYTMALDKLNLRDGDRKTENILKNAINYAYLDIATKDHNAIEIEYELDDESNIIYLPDTFLSLLRATHSKVGVLEENEYLIVNNRLILGTHIPLEGMLVLAMVLTPEELKNDDDVPEINPKYHIALLYYAMFMYSNNSHYYDLYKEITSDLDEKNKDVINGTVITESVKDVYFGYKS